MPSTVDILVRLRTAAGDGLIDAQLALRRLRSDASDTETALKSFRGAAVGLTPALAPMAAQLAPLAAGFAAAGVAVGAFGAAVAPQIKTISDSVKAQQKATDAVAQYGASSKQAVAAQNDYRAELAKMPPATQNAAAAFTSLSKAYKDWSNATAKDTMPVLTKGMADLQGILPHLTPLVESASKQFDRLVTLAGGAISTPGFDKLNRELDDFANRVLAKATDEIVHFSRALAEGKADGPLQKLMDYAKQNGPQVESTIKNVATALAHIGQAAVDAGPGMLTVVDALAKLVSAVPAPVLTRLVQLYTAFKLIKLSAAGLTIVGGQVGALARQLAVMNTASVAAGGGLAGVRAAFAALSTGTKVAGAIAVVAGVVMVLQKLSASGKAAPNIDRMTTAIGQLGRTGKVSGEAARVFGKDFSDLNYAIGRLNGQASSMDKFNDTMNKVFSLGLAKSNSAKEAAKDVDAVDKALANLVQNGQPEIAAAALSKLTAEYAKGGKPASDLTSKLDDYKSALADAKFEQDMAADSMGLFGKQAEDVQKQLDAQKQSADGLRQSIQALNDTNRAGLSAQVDFEQAIADATKSLKDNGKALHETGGQLDLGSQKARDEASALSDLAAKTDAAASAARDQGKSWQDVNAIYDTGRGKLVQLAQQMGLNKDQAKALADQILKTPDKTARLTGNIEDLQKKIAQANASLRTVPASKTAAIKANIAQLQNVVRDAQAEINALHGKTITIRSTYVSGVGNVAHEGGQYHAAGGLITGPGSGTSDSVPVMASNGEFVVNAQQTRKHRALLEAINNGASGYAKGGVVTSAEQEARSGALGSFGMPSYFGQVAGWHTPGFDKAVGQPGSVDDLVGSLNQWVSTIRAATHGAQESQLVKAFDKFGAAAIKNEQALTKVNSQLASARDKLSSLKDAAAQLKDSVSSNIVSGGSITKGGGANALGILETLQGNVNNAKTFATDLEALRKRGLNSQSLSEIAQAGVDGGLATAQQLAGASPAYIKQINDLEKQLQAAGAAAGGTTSTSVYGAGIASAQALVNGLQKQQAKLDAVMMHAADAMARQLQKAFSRKGTGGVVGAAATGGPRWGRTLVGEYGPEIADLPVGTMVRSAGDTARMLSAGGVGSSGQPIQVNLLLDGVVVARQLVDPFRGVIRGLGGNVQNALGVRGK